MTSAPPSLVVGLGGNVGGDDAVVARMVRARDALAALGEVASAPLYRTAAVTLPGAAPQPAYLNTAVRLRLAAPPPTPAEVIALVLETERRLGRDRRGEARWGPRPIDLDVLLWGDLRLRWEGPPALEVPHPRLAERRFVLAPLRALFGDGAVVVPGRTETLAALEAAVADQDVARLAPAWPAW